MANNFIFVRLEYSGGSVPTGWAEYQTGETAVLPGSLNFSGPGRRITGDMSAGVGSIASRVFFQSSITNGQTIVSLMPNGTGASTGVQCYGGTDVENTNRAALINTGSDVRVSSDTTGSGTLLPMFFYVGASERMRIETSGQTSWGGTYADISSGVAPRGLSVNNNTLFVRSDAGFSVFTRATDGTNIEFRRNATAVGSITSTATATSYTTSSDYRLKDNVQPLDAVEATNRVMAYRPVTWVWKSDGSYGKGFLAHECQAVDPMTATGTEDEMERVGRVVLADGTVAAESVRDPENLSIYGEGATWELTEVRAVYQGRDDSKMIPDMIAMMQRMELRIRELEAQVLALTPS